MFGFTFADKPVLGVPYPCCQMQWIKVTPPMGKLLLQGLSVAPGLRSEIRSSWVKTHLTVSSETCPSLATLNLTEPFTVCMRAGFCVCGEPTLLEVVTSWQRVMRAEFKLSTLRRSYLDQGFVVIRIQSTGGLGHMYDDFFTLVTLT
jgi:hypothetical protein